MQEIVSLILIGVSLSMDTFSLSLGIGPIINESKYNIFLPIIVGVFHFFMPLFGNYLGVKLIKILSLSSNILLGVILILLSIHLILDYFNEKEVSFRINIINSLVFALGVSIDSFSVGLGISDITNNYLLSSLIFAICSFVFTNFGLIIGNYSHKYMGNYANLLGILLLLILGLYHLLF